MSTIETAIKEIRPSLRLVAPQTFWFSFGFGLFNIVVGIAIIGSNIFSTLHLAGVISLQTWAIVFIVHGTAMLWSLFVNDWKTTRLLNIIGIGIKTAWFLGLVVLAIDGKAFFVLYAWGLILFLQIINYIYFMPRVGRD
jgi:hypothetical protein